MSTLNTTNIKHPSSASNNIVLDSSGNVVLQAGSASTPALQPTSDTNTGIFFPAADTIAISTAGAEVARATSDKYLRMASGTGGIQFGGDTAATNSLNDYEEGTWTVQLFDATTGGNASSTTTTGYYTKIGNLVTVNFFIQNISTAGMTSGNNLHYTLPFTPASGIVRRGSASTDTVNFATGKTALVSGIATGTARGILLQYGDNVADSFIDVAALTSGTSDFAIQMAFTV